MKNIPILTLLLVFLQGCTNDISDVEQFVASVKMIRGTGIEPMPEPSEFIHFEYSAAFLRSPFDQPQQELTIDVITQSRDCLQPDVNRNKSVLEAYGLENLVMMGSLGLSDDLWALVKTATGEVYKVKKGNYIGLFHGLITRVSEQQIELTEVVPDGSGCWMERSNSLALVSGDELKEKI